MVFVGLLLYVGRNWPKAATLAVATGGGVLAALVGLSRVYLGVHWATDVVAAWGLAVVWLALTVRAARPRYLASGPGGT
jgi:undecaprenyl-diphosphatase